MYITQRIDLSIVRKGKLKPLWVYTAEGILWRVVPTGHGLLVCETRDRERKRTRFVAISQADGRVAWQTAPFDWWLGVEAVCGGVLLLHKFAQPDMPEHRGMFALDVESGRQLWHDDDLRFEGAAGDSFFASRRRLSGAQLFQFDARSAATLREVAPGALQQTVGSGETNGRLFPLHLLNLQMESSGVAARILPHVSIKCVVGVVEYVDLGNTLVVSFHERQSASADERHVFDHRLIILSNDDIVYSDIIARNTSAIVPESFFIENDRVFFVHERTMLTAVQL